MDQDTVLALLRHALTVGGTMLVSNGYLNDGQLQTIIGGALVLATVAWSIVQKRQQRVAVRDAAATGVPMQATVSSAVSTSSPPSATPLP